MDEMNLSARAYDRILRVARTTADLEGSTMIESHPIPQPGSLDLPLRKYSNYRFDSISISMVSLMNLKDSTVEIPRRQNTTKFMIFDPSMDIVTIGRSLLSSY
jgi:hypothetical protein